MGKAGIRGDGETEAGEEGCRIGLVKKFAVVRWGWRMAWWEESGMLSEIAMEAKGRSIKRK